MFRIAICDDEQYFQEYIQGILMDYRKEKGIFYEIDTFGSGKALVESKMGFLHYQIVFLDISMDELDGIRTAQKIRKMSRDIFIVFVTAFVDYSLEGYKVDAVRFILKDNENLPAAIYECMDAIFEKLNYKAVWKEFDFTEGRKKICIDQILYIESRLHKLVFHMIGNNFQKYTLYGTLNKIEQEFTEAAFLRIHQSYLVNMKYMTAIHRYHVLLDFNITLEIPKSRYKYVQEMFCAYKGEI